MTNKRPDWLADAAEQPDKKARQPVKRPPRPNPPPQKSSPPRLTPLQMVILGGLGLALCAVLGGIGGVLFNRNTLLTVRQDTPEPTQTPTEMSPTASPSPTATATPIPTAILPAATPAPTPTATRVVAPEFINKDKIEDITGFVEQWRELALPQPLPLQFLTRQQLREQWQKQAYDQAAIEAVETQQEFYRALGLIEPEVDLGQAALENQTDLLLGYYNPADKVMYVIAESVNMFAEEEMTFAHEYVHALQDHHFNLDNILQQDRSADEQLAARSLPEGDARLVERLFTAQNITPDQLNYTVYRYLFQEHPHLEGVSPALGIFSYFPYTAGEYFVVYLYMQGNFTWDRVNQAYRQPPISTEQVMHPEKYLAGELPAPVNLPQLAPALGGAWHEIDRDVLGEAGFLVWLVDQLDEQTASSGAAGWAGDAYTLWVDEANRRLLAELSLWDTEAEAIEFFEAFSVYMNRRQANSPRYEEASTRFWEDNAGITELSRQGRQVLIIVGPDRLTVDLVRAQFAIQ